MNRFASRRRFIGIGFIAAALVAAFVFLQLRKPVLWEWRGLVFGADASILLTAPPGADIDALFHECSEEARRLESIFTLYDTDSQLRKLNRDGNLQNPAPELVELLRLCREIHEITDGAFDPTVQPLWELYRDHFEQNPDDTEGPAAVDLAAARAKVGFEHVQIGDDEIRFDRPGMSLTLNGIAQGYVTDKIAEMLQDRGHFNALVNIGEFRAMGIDLDGQPWVVGIATPDTPTQLLDAVELKNAALATSGGYGFRFDRAGGFHHLFNPDEASFNSATRSVSVEHPSAAWADALATAGSVIDDESLAQLLEKAPDAQFRVYEATEIQD